MSTKKRICGLSAVVLFTLTLSSCGGSSKKPTVDVCSKVKNIFSPSELSSLATGASATKTALDNVNKLFQLATQIPEGVQHDYLLRLASDYETITKNFSLSAFTSFEKDLMPDQIQIICPK